MRKWRPWTVNSRRSNSTPPRNTITVVCIREIKIMQSRRLKKWASILAKMVLLDSKMIRKRKLRRLIHRDKSWTRLPT